MRRNEWSRSSECAGSDLATDFGANGTTASPEPRSLIEFTHIWPAKAERQISPPDEAKVDPVDDYSNSWALAKQPV